MSQAISKEELAFELARPFGEEAQTYGAAVSDTSTAEIYCEQAGGTIVSRFTAWRDIVTLEVALWACEFAFTLAVKKSPIPIPDGVRDAAWKLIETKIRAIYMGS